MIAAAGAIGPERLVVVTSPESASAYDGSVEVAVQERPLGTGDAAATALAALEGFEGGVLIIPGDAPLVTAEMLEDLVAAHTAGGADVTVLTFTSPTPLPYGRIVRDENGNVTRIVEEKDATDEERAIEELNASYYVFDAGVARSCAGAARRGQRAGRALPHGRGRKASSRPEAARSRTAPKPTRSASPE